MAEAHAAFEQLRVRRLVRDIGESMEDSTVFHATSAMLNLRHGRRDLPPTPDFLKYLTCLVEHAGRVSDMRCSAGSHEVFSRSRCVLTAFDDAMVYADVERRGFNENVVRRAGAAIFRSLSRQLKALIPTIKARCEALLEERREAIIEATAAVTLPADLDGVRFWSREPLTRAASLVCAEWTRIALRILREDLGRFVGAEVRLALRNSVEKLSEVAGEDSSLESISARCGTLRDAIACAFDVSAATLRGADALTASYQHGVWSLLRDVASERSGFFGRLAAGFNAHVIGHVVDADFQRMIATRAHAVGSAQCAHEVAVATEHELEQLQQLLRQDWDAEIARQAAMSAAFATATDDFKRRVSGMLPEFHRVGVLALACSEARRCGVAAALRAMYDSDAKLSFNRSASVRGGAERLSGDVAIADVPADVVAGMASSFSTALLESRTRVLNPAPKSLADIQVLSEPYCVNAVIHSTGLMLSQTCATGCSGIVITAFDSMPRNACRLCPEWASGPRVTPGTTAHRRLCLRATRSRSQHGNCCA
jgi:hypothetical protein